MPTQQQLQYESYQKALVKHNKALAKYKGNVPPMLAYIDKSTGSSRVIVPLLPGREMTHGINIQCKRCYKYLTGNSFTRHACTTKYKPPKAKSKIKPTAAAAAAAVNQGSNSDDEDDDESEEEDGDDEPQADDGKKKEQKTDKQLKQEYKRAKKQAADAYGADTRHRSVKGMFEFTPFDVWKGNDNEV